METHHTNNHPPTDAIGDGTDRVDVRRVPDANSVASVAEHFVATYCADEGVLIRLSAAAGLKLSEAVGLQRRHLVRRDDRWMLRLEQRRHATVNGQRCGVGNRQTRKDASDFSSIVDIPLAASITALIDAALERIGPGADEPLCRGPRGEPVCEDTLRAHWNKTIAELFPGDHHLAGITPSSLRHHAITTWLRSGVGINRCQEWARLASSLAMLDTYAGVIEADDDASLAGLDSATDAGDTRRRVN